MQRWIRSVRGVRPKIASESVTEPAAVPSRVVTFTSMSRSSLRRRLWRRALLRRAICRRGTRQPKLAGLWHRIGQFLLHGVAHGDPAAFGARHRAFHQDEAALDVGLHHLEIERGHPLDAHMAGHLLVLEGLAGILPAASRAVRAVRDRYAVRGAQAAEVPALHRAGKALADGGAGHVDILADDEMIRRDLGADRNHRVLADAELSDLALGLDFGDGEMAAFGLGHVLDLAAAGAELQRDVTVLVLGAMSDDLALAQSQHRDRHVLAGVSEDPRHPQLLCDHPGTHGVVLLVPSGGLRA